MLSPRTTRETQIFKLTDGRELRFAPIYEPTCRYDLRRDHGLKVKDPEPRPQRLAA